VTCPCVSQAGDLDAVKEAIAAAATVTQQDQARPPPPPSRPPSLPHSLPPYHTRVPCLVPLVQWPSPETKNLLQYGRGQTTPSPWSVNSGMVHPHPTPTATVLHTAYFDGVGTTPDPPHDVAHRRMPRPSLLFFVPVRLPESCSGGTARSTMPQIAAARRWSLCCLIAALTPTAPARYGLLHTLSATVPEARRHPAHHHAPH